MPVGGDLGFSYLVLVVLLVGPVVVLLLRRKWLLSVARNEEIKRLLVFASEEAARAELEASTYVASASTEISRPLHYQCAVCFCPTTTRCARCKAVRYCSGKCQIIHWRQGHKEECRPFTISHHINEGGGVSIQKVLKQEGDEIYDNSSESDGIQCANSVKNFIEEHARSNSNCSAEVFYGNDDSEVECHSDEKGTTSSLETKRSDGQQSPYISVETNPVNKVDQNGPQYSFHTVDRLTSSRKLNQIKPKGTIHDVPDGSTSSSGWSADGVNESSFSDPSTPSSGFWDGSINSRSPKSNALGGCGKSNSSEADDGHMHNSRSSLRFGFNYGGNLVSSVDVQRSDTTAVTSDGAHSTTLGIKKPIDRASLSEETSKGTSKGMNSPVSIPEKSNKKDNNFTTHSPVSKSEEPRYTSSSANSYRATGGPSISTQAAKVGSIRSLSLERSNNVVNGMKSTLHPFESREGGSSSSSASVSNLSSSTRRHSLQGAKTGKDDSARAVATSFSEIGNYTPNAKNGLKTSMRKVVDQLRASKSTRHYQSGGGIESGGRYNNKGLFPYELFVKLYTWNKIELRPCGLTNCGNSCYANAVLQCLACTPPLSAYLLQGLHSKICEKKEWCFTCQFESLILKAKEGRSPLSPIGILSQIQNLGSHLGNGRQEDAHEFLRYAIDAMQSVCLKEAGINASGSIEEETTLIGLTFGGYLRSKIKCLKCGGKSEQHERMMDLTVEIGGDIGTLEEALRQFSCTEILDGENKYHCYRCKSYERAKKKMTILEAPNILTIALKRFQSGKFGKLNKSIRFPEILNLAPCMSGTSDKSPIYRLYGVVVHLDVMNEAFSGHYVCYVKTIQNKWFKIDDSTVKAVELESVLTKGAYMLLYSRCSPRAPRLIRHSLPCDPRKLKSPTFESRSHPWDSSKGDPVNGQTGIECLYSNHSIFQPIRTIVEEDSSSENSSSLFSEGCSCSTDSTNRDSSSTDDYFDLFFGDVGRNWNSPWRNSSDSDSSSSSSSSSPSQIRNVESGTDSRSFWEGKSRVPFLYSDSTKQCRKLGTSSSCRETNSDKLGSSNPLDNKKPGVSFSRSTRERTD